MIHEFKEFPTKWPLFEFYFGIWKLQIKVMAFKPGIEYLGYEYATLFIEWNGRQIYKFRLYETYYRVEARLKELMHGGVDYTTEQLEEISKIANEEIERRKKL